MVSIYLGSKQNLECSKISNSFHALFSNKMLVVNARTHKFLPEKQAGKTLIRLLLQKQSDLGLRCLSRAFLAGNECMKF